MDSFLLWLSCYLIGIVLVCLWHLYNEIQNVDKIYCTLQEQVSVCAVAERGELFILCLTNLNLWGQMPFQWPWSRCQELVCPSCDQSPLWKGKLDPEISAGCHGTRNEEIESPFYYMINDENRIIIMCFRLVFQSSQAYILMMSNSLCVVDRLLLL